MATSNWVNRTIFTGDNLDIMRGMNAETVDLIYLDPPFNSNKNYSAPVGSKAAGAAFKDTWTLSDLDVAWMGLIADEQPAIYKLLETARLTHGKGMQSYLCMMAVRLVEMRRLLKPTGSIYLHCDPTASHYLKLMMDSIFGAAQFKNEVIWKRTSSHSDATRYGNVHDILLFYTKSTKPIWNRTYQEYEPGYVERYYRNQDDDGRRWMSGDIGAAGLQGGGYEYEWKGITRVWRVPHKTMALLDAQGKVFYTRNGFPRRKRYLDEAKGIPTQDVWADIQAIRSWHKEKIGYPTQKPLAFLERIIKASSNEGDVVLDPFAGCATACVAAEQLDRQWVGIDLSEKAVELVNYRLQDTLGSLYHYGFVTSRKDNPQRTDLEKIPNYRKSKHVLFGQQEGVCNGCKMDFPFKIFAVDHKLPKSKGGPDHIDNLQLLCGHCNSIKGDRPMDYLMAQLAKVSEVSAYR